MKSSSQSCIVQPDQENTRKRTYSKHMETNTDMEGNP